MTESADSSRSHTPVELIVGGVIGAVLGWPIGRALDAWVGDNEMPWWMYLVGAAIGIAAVLFIMTFFIKRWRTAAWGWLGRLAKWSWDSRPVSQRKHRTALEEHRKAVLRDTQRLAKIAVKDAIEERKRIDASIQQLATTLSSQGRTAPGAAAEQPKAPPLPTPRWRIRRDESDESCETFTLINSVERSIAREVRVDDSHDYNGEPNGVATILEGGHFEDLSGKASGDFRAEFSSRSRQSGGSLDVTWYDENAEKQHEYLVVPGWEEAPAGPAPRDIWSAEETPF